MYSYKKSIDVYDIFLIVLLKNIFGWIKSYNNLLLDLAPPEIIRTTQNY